MLNNSLHSSKVGIYATKSLKLLSNEDFGDFGVFERCGNCIGAVIEHPIKMRKRPSVPPDDALQKYLARNILAKSASVNQKIHQLFLMHYRQRHLTRCLELLEQLGFTENTAIFMMGWLGGAV